MRKFTVNVLSIIFTLASIFFFACKEPKDPLEIQKEWNEFSLAQTNEFNDGWFKKVKRYEEDCLERWEGNKKRQEECKNKAQGLADQCIPKSEELRTKLQEQCQDLTERYPDWFEKTNEERERIKSEAIATAQKIVTEALNAFHKLLVDASGDMDLVSCTTNKNLIHNGIKGGMNRFIRESLPSGENHALSLMAKAEINLQKNGDSAKVSLKRINGSVVLDSHSFPVRGEVTTRWNTSNRTWELEETQKLDIKLSGEIDFNAVTARKNKFKTSKDDVSLGTFACDEGVFNLTLPAEVENSFIPKRAVFIDIPLTGYVEGGGCNNGPVTLVFNGDLRDLFPEPVDECIPHS